ncbi:MAG: FkbM family methyltransferase [Cytophagaceae bacterium]
MRQLLKAFLHLLPRLFSDKNFLIFLNYKKLFLYSFLLHRFKPTTADKEKQVAIFGHTISFFNYPVLINQFEEIFIYRSYRFESEKKSPLIFDCGSNIGISVLYFKIFYPSCKISAFEPDPENFMLLKRNVEQNRFSDIVLNACALGKEEGICKLFSYGKGSLNTSIYSNDTKEFIEVPMRKLSSHIVGEIDFMKMDVEGAEGEIVQELAYSGKLKNVREMVLEYHQKSLVRESELVSVMKNAGFLALNHPQVYLSGPEKLLHFKKIEA